MRVMIRVFLGGRLDSEQLVVFTDEAESLNMVDDFARRHAAQLAATPGMIEFEFLDIDDPLERFHRIGNDPSMMVNPIEVRFHNHDIN